ncbi:MAG TPA: methyltransferase domain-containing protein [Solirubrobacterales bacterium]|nr:methyltransferase domain-containing protein [Solirubrobacterales bacterium]
MATDREYDAVTASQQRTWSDGDFSMVASLVVYPSENLVEALEILPDERVLDVACGSGNGAIAAARRAWGNTVGCDFVPALLDRARERAVAERLDIEFVEGEAQALPFEDGSFDVTMSIFGAMFAADHQRTADELLRVVKPGGRIGMANWVPDGGLSDFFAILVKHTGGPPPGTTPPVLWGSEDHVRELFGDRISELRTERRANRQAFRSPEHYLDFFRAYFGPVRAAFEQVGPDGAPALETDLREYLEDVRGDAKALVIEPEYLQIVAVRA